MQYLSKVEKILLKFIDCENKSNEEINEALYFAYCALPKYNSDQHNLVINRTTSIEFDFLDDAGWEFELASNIGKLFRCMITISKMTRFSLLGKSKTVYHFTFIGVEVDSVLASKIFNNVYKALMFRRNQYLYGESVSGQSRRVGGKKTLISVPHKVTKANIYCKSLVEDISDFAEPIFSNEFKDLISENIVREDHSSSFIH